MDVEQLLLEKNISYRTQGADYLVKCLNPEHDDSNPSMRIDRITGVFQCFSCKFKGNIFKFFGKNVSKIEQRTLLLKQKILELQRPKTIDIPSDARLFDREYRGISANTFNKFNAFTTDELKEFKERVVFPICNLNGDTIGLMGRYIYSDAKPKYLVRPHKVKLPLFPALPTPINGAIILVEGIFDCINLIDKGLTNAVCTLGTSTISEKSFDRLFSYMRVLGVHTVYTMFDDDDAGAVATKNVNKILKSKGFSTDNIIIPGEYNDPGEFPLEVVQALREHFDNENSDSREESN